MNHLVKIGNTVFISISILSCTSKQGTDENILKQEIIDAESDFARMAGEKGLKVAFVEFAAVNAVIKRGGEIIKGRNDIGKYYAGQTKGNAKLAWEPQYIDVAASGDLAYTYGPYTYSFLDSLDNAIESTGFFHTVWKRQPGGAWKFVYD